MTRASAPRRPTAARGPARRRWTALAVAGATALGGAGALAATAVDSPGSAPGAAATASRPLAAPTATAVAAKSPAITYRVAAGTGTGRTFYVATTGSDTAPGTSARPFRTIRRATTATGLRGGDTIVVRKGVYTEKVALTASGSAKRGHITLRGQGAVLRDPTPKGPDEFGVGTIAAKGVSHWLIEGFRVENAQWAAIMLMGTKDMVVANNTTVRSGASGIIALPLNHFDGGEKEVQSARVTVVGNRIVRANDRFCGVVNGCDGSQGSQEALSIWGVDGFEVAGNTIESGKKEGIDCKTGCRNGRIHHNTIRGTASLEGLREGFQGGAAIYVDGHRSVVKNVHIHSNLVYGNVADGIALAVEVPGQGESDLRNVIVRNNIVHSNGRQGVNGGHGLVIGENITGVSAYHNTFYKNVQGVVVQKAYGGYASRGLVVRNNLIAASTYRSGVVGGVAELTLKDNVFAPAGSKGFERDGAAIPSLTETGTKVVADPRFVKAPTDLRLRAGSPAAGSGARGAVGAPGTKAVRSR